MIRRIEAHGYRSLRNVEQEIRDFQVLVGPNGSGKSSFLDVVGLIGDLLRSGLSAVRSRSPNFADLIWMGDKRDHFALAVELEIPSARTAKLGVDRFSRARYSLDVGLDPKGELSINAELLYSKEPTSHRNPMVSKGPFGTDLFYSETDDSEITFRLGPKRLALANLPEDEEQFPAATWVKRSLMEGVQLLVLKSEAMRRPAPPGSPTEFQPDGSNLPWAIEDLRKDPERFQRWIDHIRTALPDIETIETIDREEDRHRYLRIVYRNGLKVPSWNVSDGTLRLLALTLVGYLTGSGRIYLIEEPENGIHPQAIETVFQALSSAYGDQILCATHSPVFLAMAEPEQVLCFSRTPEGATEVMSGSQHPALKDWKRSTDLGTLFASGILG
jgi:predicted ATPase